MGSDQQKKKKRKDKQRERSRKKDKKKSRDRTPSSSSQSSQTVKRKKKIKKRSIEPESKGGMNKHIPPPSYPYPPNFPYLNPMNPPPPTQPTATVVAKSSKTKQLNLFKVLPNLQWSLIMFANTIFSIDLLGQSNFEIMMNKFWKALDKKIKTIGIKRLTKLVGDGINLNQKLFSKENMSKMQIETKQTNAEQASIKYTDFQILTAIYEKKNTIQQISKMIGPNNKLKLEDVIPKMI